MTNTTTDTRQLKQSHLANAPSPSYSLFWVIFALGLGGFCIGTTEFVAMGLIQEIASNLQVSVPEAGHFISAYALGVVIGAPVIAIFAAKVPRKTMLLLLMLFYALANLATALANDAVWVLISRFVAGLPHGAYFGIASLVAAELAGPQKRATAVARIMLGLTLATVLGVPMATWLGQSFGWRAGFELSALLAVICVFAVAALLPKVPVQATASIRMELAGLKNLQMWMTLSIGAIGFGGLFSVYTYISPILTEYTHANIQIVPVALAVLGLGMVVGGLTAGWLADKNLNRTMIAVLISSACSFVLASFLMEQLYSALIALFLIGLSIIGLGGALQIKLMDVAGNAQTLAASLNHSAFNFANALGAFLGGWVIHQQMGWMAPIWVGFVLSLIGLAILLMTLALARKAQA